MRLHSWLSSKCVVRPSHKGGLGLFANTPISEGELVSVWGGCVYNEEEIRRLGNVSSHFRTHPVEVAPGLYLASTNVFAVDDVERINHSCEPNIGIKGQIVLLARRPIASGEELTIDYETLSPSQPGAEFHCTCGSANCRERIDGHILHSAAWVRKNQSWLSWRVAESLKPETGTVGVGKETALPSKSPRRRRR